MQHEKSHRPKNGAPDAIALLTEDHKKVQKLFKEFKKIKEANSDNDKQDLVKEICNELTIHAQLEEEIFYPAARETIDEQDLLDEAEVEHASAKELIAQLQSMEADDELYDATVTVLGEYVTHHIQEEQEEIFPKLKKAKLDTQALGAEIMQRKLELRAEMGIAEPREEEMEMPEMNRRAAKR